MSFYGKLSAALISMVLVGGGAAYYSNIGTDVMKRVTELTDSIGCYIIKEYQGMIALFKEGSDTPLAVYSLPADSLSSADEELLKEGIRLRGSDEVTRLLEDLDIELP